MNAGGDTREPRPERERGTPLEEQEFDWKDIAGAPPYSKLDADAFSRVRVILMNGIESEALRFQHAMARCHDGELRLALARIRRKEQHQQTLVNWLNPADQSPLETTIGYEQVAIEVTSHLAKQEPDPYLAQIYRFGLLEDFDHMYRYAALLDRLEGKDGSASGSRSSSGGPCRRPASASRRSWTSRRSAEARPPPHGAAAGALRPA